MVSGLAATTDEVVQGARLLNFLPYLKEEIDKLLANLDMRVKQKLSDGTLTPEEAYNFWLEKASYDTLYKRFDTKARVAASQGDKKRAELALPS